jgi:hypothetical protein
MFQSYEYLEHLYDTNTNEYRWRYKIVDTEFEEVGVGAGLAVAVVAVGVGVGNGAVVAVIDTYSNRGLPVVPNLIIAFQWHSSEYGYSLEQVIALQKQYNPQYKQYEEEIERYLVLL